jgi:hypothetical protein
VHRLFHAHLFPACAHWRYKNGEWALAALSGCLNTSGLRFSPVPQPTTGPAPHTTTHNTPHPAPSCFLLLAFASCAQLDSTQRPQLAIRPPTPYSLPPLCARTKGGCFYICSREDRGHGGELRPFSSGAKNNPGLQLVIPGGRHRFGHS